jgi:AcrR family transcriptional regulator
MHQGKKEKQAAIMQAALELFAENGFHRAPVSQLATKAKVAVGSIYRCFKDKDELVHALYKEVDETLWRTVIEGTDPRMSDRLQFIHLITNLIHYLRDHPLEFKFLEQYFNSPYGLEKKREKILEEDPAGCRNPLKRIFSGGNEGAVKDLPLSILHAMAFGPVTFVLRDAMAGLVTLDDRVIQEVAQACWDAIKK